MSTYVVGDLQGCLSPLKRLLDDAGFEKKTDTLWCTGDIVNRGPESLETLRFIHGLGDACITVLGNHDLHLLAIAFGNAPLKRSDTLQEILDAPDANALLDWLRHRPLLHHEYGFTLVHAGIAPPWTIAEAASYAREVENCLQSDNFQGYLTHMYGNQPDIWDNGLTEYDRLRVITNYFTRMRFCYSDGRLDLSNKQAPEHAKPGTLPWFNLPERAAAQDNILFGHWAALMGKTDTPCIFPLDTGCVWGECLTMMRLEDRRYFRCHCSS